MVTALSSGTLALAASALWQTKFVCSAFVVKSVHCVPRHQLHTSLNRGRSSFATRYNLGRPQLRRYDGTIIRVISTNDPYHADRQRDSKIILSSVRGSLRRNLFKPQVDDAETRLRFDVNNSTVVLLLAVSGGCDSVALFHSVLALTSKKESKGRMHKTRYLHLNMEDQESDESPILCELHVAHFNHKQRGASSDADEAFVKRLCTEAGIPFYSYSWSELNNTDSFSQDVARKWRRKQLVGLLKALVAEQCDRNEDGSSRWGAILTAHHRDDSEETMLLKLLRGAHLTNLSGMEERSNGFQLNADEKYRSIGYFLKPLLGLRKNDIVDYLMTNNLEWREDESNAENKYKRNKVRNQLIPLLSEIAGGEDALHKRLCNLEQQSRELSRYLTEQAEEYLEKLSIKSVFILPDDFNAFNIIQQEALHMWAEKSTNGNLTLSYNQVMRIKDQLELSPNRLQWSFDVGDCWTIIRNGKTLSLTKTNYDANECFKESESAVVSWEISSKGDLENSSLAIDVHELNFGNLAPGAGISHMTIKQAKDTSYLKFIPIWRKGRSPLKIREFLRGQKIPLHSRDGAFVLTYFDGSVEHALAVYVENRDEWMLHSDFVHKHGESVKISLMKKYHS